MNWAAVGANVGAQPANVGAILEDANIAWDPQGMGKFRVVFGQYKVPFGRQQMTSSGNQQFVDRSLVADEYERGRDIGVSVQGAVWSNKIEYRVGMFNGNGLNRPSNDNDKFQYNARLMWQPNGNQVLAQRAWVSGALYSEADFESTTASAVCLRPQFREQRLPWDHDRHRLEVDRRRDRRRVQVQGLFNDRGVLLPQANARERGEVRLEWRLSSGRHDAQSVPHVGSRRPIRPA